MMVDAPAAQKKCRFGEPSDGASAENRWLRKEKRVEPVHARPHFPRAGKANEQ
jgi:hypothetical protein